MATQQQQDFQAGLQHLALQQQAALAMPVRLVYQPQHQQQVLVLPVPGLVQFLRQQ
jgi:hypothetical protein